MLVTSLARLAPVCYLKRQGHHCSLALLTLILDRSANLLHDVETDHQT